MKRARELVGRAVEKMQGKKSEAEQGSSSKNDVSRYPKDLAKNTFASQSFDELDFSNGAEARKYTKYQREYFSPDDIVSVPYAQGISQEKHLEQQQRKHNDMPQYYKQLIDQKYSKKHEGIRKKYNSQRKELDAQIGKPGFDYDDELDKMTTERAEKMRELKTWRDEEVANIDNQRTSPRRERIVID